MALDNASTTPAPADNKVREFSSVTEATLALGSKTYTGTVAQGGGNLSTLPSAK